MALSCALTNCATEERIVIEGFTPLKRFHRLPVQNNGSSNTVFSAIKQLVVSCLVSFWRLGPYLFNKHEKTIWWRLFFRDTEPWRDACFKRVLAIELSRNVSRYWQCTRSQKASLILQKMVQRKMLPVSGLVLVQIVWFVSNFMYRCHSLVRL